MEGRAPESNGVFRAEAAALLIRGDDRPGPHEETQQAQGSRSSPFLKQEAHGLGISRALGLRASSILHPVVPHIPRTKDRSMTPTTLLHALNYSYRRRRNDALSRNRSRLRRNGLRSWAVERMEERTLLSPYLVTTTADGGPGSLRDAITQVNADSLYTLYTDPGNPARDEIDFNISSATDTGGGYDAATGLATIRPTSPLPSVDSSVLINGYSQSNSRWNTLAVGDDANLEIELNGSNLINANGLWITAGQSTVQGLVVNGFTGVTAPFGIAVTGAGDVVQGCFIGTDPSGTVAKPNGYNGVVLAGAGTRLGTNGDGMNDYGERNIVSGNITRGVQAGPGTVVAGNYIGTDHTGENPLPNGNLGIEAAPGSRVGVDGCDADAMAERNVISGNSGDGVNAYAGTVVAGNYIGIDAAGGHPLGNSPTGVVAEGGALIGTNGDGFGDDLERNVISGNVQLGVYVVDSDNHIAGNYIGTNPDGSAPLGNQPIGIRIDGTKNYVGVDPADGSHNPAHERNVVSGNTYQNINLRGGDNTVSGNYIGPDATGTTSLSPGSVGVQPGSGDVVGVHIPTDANGNVIGPYSAGQYDELERNIISGNGTGVEIVGGNGSVIRGNYIGPDVTGTTITNLGNNSAGVLIHFTTTGNQILQNVIAGSSNGVRLLGPAVSNNVIAGNKIGTDVTGKVALPNSTGVDVEDSPGNTIGGTALGDGNVISGNRDDGVDIQGSSSTGNSVRGNSIFSNGFGIDLGGDGVTRNDSRGHIGPNDWQNFPVLTAVLAGAATTISGTLSSAANTAFALDFYANDKADPSGYGQGQYYLGSTTSPVQTDGSGKANFEVTLPANTNCGEFLSATATVLSTTVPGITVGDTSEFSRDLSIEVPPTAAAGGPYSIHEGDSLTLDASASSDSDGDPLTYSWDLNGDGIFGDATGVSPTLTWAQLQALGVGDETSTPINVRVRVSDVNCGTTTSPATTLQVLDAPLTAATGVNLSAPEGASTGTVVVAAFTDPGGSEAIGNYSAVITWGDTDGSGHPLSSPGTIVDLGGGHFQVQGSHTYADEGTYNMSVAITHDALAPVIATGTANVADDVRVLLLDPSGQGALTDSGNGSVFVGGAGVITVASTSSAAVVVTGNGNIKANELDLHSSTGTQVTGKGTIPGDINHGIAAAEAADPLASLTIPTPPSATYAGVNYSGSSPLPLQPGTYLGGIQISGKAAVTLAPGIYYLKGGGLHVSGQASVTGNDVLIYNAPQAATDTISLLGQASIFLTGRGSEDPTYQGIAIFQDRTAAAPIIVGGSGGLSVTGTVYAAGAAVNLAGNGPLSIQGPTGRLISADLNLTVNGGLLVNTTGSASGSTQGLVAADSSGTTAGTTNLVNAIGDLVAGMHTVAVDALAGDAVAEEAQIEDAIAELDAELAPYGVSLVEVFGDTAADIHIQVASTGAIGGVAQGVLGVTIGGNSITLIDGWNWYTGSDPNAIAADQYDFETVVTHELGHAVGLGHSSDSASVMYPFLQAGVTRRNLGAGDLNVLDLEAGTGPEPLKAVARAGAAGAGVNPAATGESLAGVLAGSPGQALPGGLTVIASASASSSITLAAPAAPGARPTVVSSGTPTLGARRVPLLVGSTGKGDRASSIGMASDEDQEPALGPSIDHDDRHRVERSTSVEAAPILMPSFPQTWDDAIDAYIADGHEPARSSDAPAQPPAVATDPALSTLDAALTAGVAVALWGSWEIRSRRDNRRRRP
jgi:hypothetical protein